MVVDKLLIFSLSKVYIKIVNFWLGCKWLINNGIVLFVTTKRCTFANYLSTIEK